MSINIAKMFCTQDRIRCVAIHIHVSISEGERKSSVILKVKYSLIDYFIFYNVSSLGKTVKIRWCFDLAIKYLFPNGKKYSFLSFISIIGVALGEMILFVVNSVMDGFQTKICSKIVNTQGDIRIDSDNIITNLDEIFHIIKNNDNVRAASSYIMGFLMLQFEGRQAYPMAKGIVLDDEMNVMPLSSYIIVGDVKDFDDDKIIISSGLAQNLGIKVGDLVDIYSPLILQSLQNDELILPKTFKVAAIYSSGWNQIDSGFIMLTKQSMEELYGMRIDECHGFCVRLYDKKFIADTILKLKKTLPSFRICSWQEINEDFLFVLRLEKSIMMFVLLFILLVASFSIASSLMISVIKKRREIGLLYALGASLREVATVFIFEGIIIGICGNILGFGLGVLLLFLRNSILALLTRFVGVNDWMLRFYDFAELSVQYSLSGILTIIIFTMIICCLAGTLPALAVSKTVPAEALRNE